jgi:hypothetical protein
MQWERVMHYWRAHGRSSTRQLQNCASRIFPLELVLKLKCASDLSGGLFKTQISGPTPQCVIHQVWAGPKIHFPDKFPVTLRLLVQILTLRTSDLEQHFFWSLTVDPSFDSLLPRFCCYVVYCYQSNTCCKSNMQKLSDT